MVVKDGKTEKGFRKLIVWQKAHQWVLLIYKLTEKLPKHETFGLVSQMRRAAVSVAANMLKLSIISFLHLILNTLLKPNTSKPNPFDLKWDIYLIN